MKAQEKKKLKVLFGTFAAVAAACVSASIADIAGVNQIYIIEPFVSKICTDIYLAVLAILPFISLIAENKAVNNKELSRASYLIYYFIGYFLAGSVCFLCFRFIGHNPEIFYPNAEPDDLGTVPVLGFLWLALFVGFIWAVVFRAVAALIHFMWEQYTLYGRN